MENRTFSFVFIATIVFGILMLTQSFFFKPEVPQGADADKQEQVEDKNKGQEKETDDDGQGDNEKDDANEKQDGDNQDDSTGDDSQTYPGAEQESNNGNADNESAGNDENSKQADDGDKTKQQVAPANPPTYVTLGSVAKDSDERFLVTFTSRGASIHRMELNSRLKSGRLRYREIEIDHGYFGNLELTEVAGKGCQVNCVGHGTPAEKVGIKVGDIITAIDGEKSLTLEEYEAALFEKEPGQKITVSILRGANSNQGTGNKLELDVTLAQQPMEILRPVNEDVSDWLNTLQLTLHTSENSPWPELDKGMRTGNWQVRETDKSGNPLTKNGRPMIEFVFTINENAEEDSGLVGPIEVVKRFWLTSQGRKKDFDRGYHINFEFDIRNLGDKPQKLNYQIVGPTGTPIEGWWYQNKIHGGTWAIGYGAGARDVVSRNVAEHYRFIGGPQIVAEVFENDPQPIFIVDPDKTDENQQIYYLGVDTQYFTAALFPGTDGSVETFENVEPLDIYSAFATLTREEGLPKNKKLRRTVDLTFRMFSNEIQLGPAGSKNDSFTQGYHFFAGPKEPTLLSEYGLEDCRTYGWSAVFARPLTGLLRLFYWPTGNYALAIIMLTVLVRSLMIPISRKAALNAQMMQYLQPEIKRIADHYKDDMQKRASAQRELFARYKYNPLGGCLLMFIQLPIFMGLYRGLSVDIALRDQPLIPGLDWCSNLAAPDQLFRWDSWMPGFIADQTGWLGPYFNLLPILTIVLFLVQQKMFMPPATDDQQKMTQRMMTLMMVFMGVLFFKVPSGLCLYFVTSSIWGIIERKMIPKPKLPDNLPPLDGSKSGKKGPSPRPDISESKVIERDHAQMAERKRKDKERRRRLKGRGKNE